jgi:hypothetical protein
MHGVFGTGQVGVALAARLAPEAEAVRTVSRHGPPALGEGFDWHAADASNPEAATEAAKGPSVVYLCLNAPYIAWPELFPMLQRGVLAAAEHADALLVTLENVYGYGPTGGRAMTEDLPRCPYCHRWEVRDQPVGVIGAHPGSAQHALLVRQWSEDIDFFVHTYDLTSSKQHQLKARGIETVVGGVAQLVVEHDRLTGVKLADGRVVARTAVFVRSGNRTHDDGLLAGLSCELEDGFRLVRNAGLTSGHGVWAAGNVADPRAQVDP